ncbi:MAG: hypothetical protein ABJO29_16195 [Yoonia sp.]|uniref:hypothetical protein n=1 Tax=Yoonia sp. TaxID=2212373 RepID=UPI003263FCAD
MASEDEWNLSLTSPEDASCHGVLVPGTTGLLEGRISCTDGQKGEVSLAFNNHRGFGVISLADTDFLATIGD